MIYKLQNNFESESVSDGLSSGYSRRAGAITFEMNETNTENSVLIELF